MAEASGLVLGGFQLRSEAKVIHYPNRFEDERGKRMWDTVQGIIGELSSQSTCASANMINVQQRNNPVARPHTRAILSLSTNKDSL